MPSTNPTRLARAGRDAEDLQVRIHQHPAPLAENAGLAFAGAHVSSRLILAPRTAKRLLAARNWHGKPNIDAVRPYVDAHDIVSQGGELPGWSALPCPPKPPAKDGPPTRWVVDYPADTTPEEASLYAEPWRLFAKAGGVLHARADPMRIAIARIDSYLVAPLGRSVHGFVRFDSATLPGTGLCVVATDDDFLAAVLNSGVFAAWVAAHGRRLRVHHVASFPLPWPPRTGRGALTRAQLELRDTVLRARAADLDDAVAATYGWHDIGDEADLVERLRALNSRRAPRISMPSETPRSWHCSHAAISSST